MGFVGGYRHIEQVRVVRSIAARSLASLMSRLDSFLKRASLISPVLSQAQTPGCLVRTDTPRVLTAIVCEDVTYQRLRTFNGENVLLLPWGHLASVRVLRRSIVSNGSSVKAIT